MGVVALNGGCFNWLQSALSINQFGVQAIIKLKLEYEEILEIIY